MPDPRDPELARYKIQTLLWTGVLMFVLRLGARRQIQFRLHPPNVAARAKRLTGQDVDTVPHGDTLGKPLARVAPEPIQKVVVARVRTLLETRRLEKFRLLDRYYLVAADMSGHLYLGDQPSAFTQGCLTQTAEDGRTLYYHPVMEAKRVTGAGRKAPRGRTGKPAGVPFTADLRSARARGWPSP